MKNENKKYTLEDVWQMFAETDIRFQELAEQSAESSKETDRQFQELAEQSAERSKEADRQFQELAEQSAERSKETDLRFQQTEELVRKLTKATTLHESYIDNQSAKVERFFIEAIRNNGCRIGEIEFDEIQPNIERLNSQDGIELDGLLLNGKYVGILEVKSTLHEKDVERTLTKLSRFRSHFKEYAHKELLVYVGGEIVHDDALQTAHELGFIILTPDGQKINVNQTKVVYY